MALPAGLAETRRRSLQDLVLGCPRLLEYIGRNLVKRRDLIGVALSGYTWKYSEAITAAVYFL